MIQNIYRKTRKFYICKMINMSFIFLQHIYVIDRNSNQLTIFFVDSEAATFEGSCSAFLKLNSKLFIHIKLRELKIYFIIQKSVFVLIYKLYKSAHISTHFFN